MIWGLHRDTTELRIIRLPVFSQGALPAGPQRLDAQEADALTSARIGDHIVTGDDFVLADYDRVLFLPLDRAADIAALAATIRDTERRSTPDHSTRLVSKRGCLPSTRDWVCKDAAAPSLRKARACRPTCPASASLDSIEPL